MVDSVTKKPIWKHEIIDADGFACVGQPVEPKQVCFALMQKIELDENTFTFLGFN